MLAVTEDAASAIDGILASPEVPDEAGLRITAKIEMSEEGAPKSELRLGVVDAPEAGDQVIEDAAVFLQPEAATLLDDKVLDADVADNEVRFNLTQQT